MVFYVMLIGALFFNDTQKLHAPGGIESLIPLLLVIVGSYTSVVFMVLTRNIIINSLKLGTTATFRSNLRDNRFLWISFSNLILTVLTVFLMYPWAKIRSYRYQAEALTIEPKVTVAAFTDDEVRKQSALGEEFGEFQDIDISI